MIERLFCSKIVENSAKTTIYLAFTGDNILKSDIKYCSKISQ